MIYLQTVLRGAGHRRRTSNLNIEPPTSNTQHPEPNTATKRKRQRKPRWISVPDQEGGPVRGLWYQGMSRVCPECPQTAPSEAGEGGCIRKVYTEHRTLNLEPRTSNLEQPGRATPSHPQATLRPPSGSLVANR
jgi:hypothetical protein